MRRRLLRASLLAVMLAVLGTAGSASAQYFGQNKVQYDDFEFKTYSTDHFDIYFYPEERTAVMDAGRMAERWYQRHSRTFLREFEKRKPLIFYANSADFQQTNAVQGQLGQGTGGVTESIKERVIMPLTGSYAETDHVLGHELVHSFQYDIALRKNNRGFSLRNLPLWLVEGMAEYLSVGEVDTHIHVAAGRGSSGGSTDDSANDAQYARILSVPLRTGLLGVHRWEVRRCGGHGFV